MHIHMYTLPFLVVCERYSCKTSLANRPSSVFSKQAHREKNLRSLFSLQLLRVLPPEHGISVFGGALSLEADDIPLLERVLSPHGSRDLVPPFEGALSLQRAEPALFLSHGLLLLGEAGWERLVLFSD